ncbi:MAG: hypothetical protein FWD59_05460, partial [Micrococcales bacterium]|nr:hypothetical protein [Micrococcales bacterium]
MTEYGPPLSRRTLREAVVDSAERAGARVPPRSAPVWDTGRRDEGYELLSPRPELTQMYPGSRPIPVVPHTGDGPEMPHAMPSLDFDLFPRPAPSRALPRPISSDVSVVSPEPRPDRWEPAGRRQAGPRIGAPSRPISTVIPGTTSGSTPEFPPRTMAAQPSRLPPEFSPWLSAPGAPGAPAGPVPRPPERSPWLNASDAPAAPGTSGAHGAPGASGGSAPRPDARSRPAWPAPRGIDHPSQGPLPPREPLPGSVIPSRSGGMVSPPRGEGIPSPTRGNDVPLTGHPHPHPHPSAAGLPAAGHLGAHPHPTGIAPGMDRPFSVAAVSGPLAFSEPDWDAVGRTPTPAPISRPISRPVPVIPPQPAEHVGMADPASLAPVAPFAAALPPVYATGSVNVVDPSEQVGAPDESSLLPWGEPATPPPPVMDAPVVPEEWVAPVPVPEPAPSERLEIPSWPDTPPEEPSAPPVEEWPAEPVPPTEEEPLAPPYDLAAPELLEDPFEALDHPPVTDDAPPLPAAVPDAPVLEFADTAPEANGLAGEAFLPAPVFEDPPAGGITWEDPFASDAFATFAPDAFTPFSEVLGAVAPESDPARDQDLGPAPSPGDAAAAPTPESWPETPPPPARKKPSKVRVVLVRILFVLLMGAAAAVAAWAIYRAVTAAAEPLAWAFGVPEMGALAATWLLPRNLRPQANLTSHNRLTSQAHLTSHTHLTSQAHPTSHTHLTSHPRPTTHTHPTPQAH